MRDDGINYLQDMLVIPPDQILAVQQRLWSMENGEDASDQSFGWQGR